MKLCIIYRFVTLLHYTVISGEHKELQMTNQPWWSLHVWVQLNVRIRCPEFWKINAITLQTHAFSDDGWKCRVSLMQWRCIAKYSTSREVVQRWITHGYQLSYHMKIVWQRGNVHGDCRLLLVSTSGIWRSSFAIYCTAIHAHIERRQQTV